MGTAVTDRQMSRACRFASLQHPLHGTWQRQPCPQPRQRPVGQPPQPPARSRAPSGLLRLSDVLPRAPGRAHCPDPAAPRCRRRAERGSGGRAAAAQQRRAPAAAEPRRQEQRQTRAMRRTTMGRRWSSGWRCSRTWSRRQVRAGTVESAEESAEGVHLCSIRGTCACPLAVGLTKGPACAAVQSCWCHTTAPLSTSG